MRLWINKSEYGYSTYIKNEYNGKKITMFMDVQFINGTEPDETIYANVTDCFFSCYESKDGVKPKLVIKEYERIEKNDSDEIDVTDEFLNEDDDVVNIDDNFLD